MKQLPKLSFVSRLGLCMVLSLALNLFLGNFLGSKLSQTNYELRVETGYNAPSTMELHFDTGADFNNRQYVAVDVAEGTHKLRIPFQMQDGQQLRFLRLDFGNNPRLSKIRLNNMALFANEKFLFGLNGIQLSKKIGLLQGMEKDNETDAVFHLDTKKNPFDPYIVFSPLNEIIFPLWQRTLFLILPWGVLFFLPLLKWFNRIRKDGDYVLIFIGLFCAAIPLKIAWVTFTTLSLVAYALFNYYKKRKVKFDASYLALLVFFLVPLVFIGDGDVSKLCIPIGFVLLVIIGSLVDFSEKRNQGKKIYITVFFLVASITTVSWLLLMSYYGYYYKIDLPGYFMDIKTHAHATMFWLYYPHTTFLSFFIVIGGIFCFDLYKKKEIGRTYGLLYGVLGLCTLLLLGSRFAVLMGVSLPILVQFSAKKIGRWLVPAWAVIAALVVFFIGDIDFRRNQLWRVSWEAFKEKPWLGHGTGSSDAILNDLERVRSAGFDMALDMNHPHNQFLTYLLENGLLGTLLVLGAFLYIVYRFAKQRNKSMLLVCFMVLLLMMTESPFRTSTPLYVIGFLFSVFALEQKPNASNLNK